MTQVPSGPTHFMDRQLFIPQNTDLVVISILLLVKVLVLQSSLIFEDLLERIAQFALTPTFAASQLGRDIHYLWSIKLSLGVSLVLMQTFSHWLQSFGYFLLFYRRVALRIKGLTVSNFREETTLPDACNCLQEIVVVLSIKKRDNGVISVPLGDISLGEWSAHYGVAVSGGTVSATAVVLSSQMGHSPGAGGIVIECFEARVLDGFEVAVGWGEIQVDDVMWVV